MMDELGFPKGVVMDGSDDVMGKVFDVMETIRQSGVAALMKLGYSREEAERQSRIMRVSADGMGLTNAFGVNTDGSLRGLTDRDAKISPDEAREAIRNHTAFLELADRYEAAQQVARNMMIVSAIPACPYLPTVPLATIRMADGNADEGTVDTMKRAMVQAQAKGFNPLSGTSDGDAYLTKVMLPCTEAELTSLVDQDLPLWRQTQIIEKMAIPNDGRYQFVGEMRHLPDALHLQNFRYSELGGYLLMDFPRCGFGRQQLRDVPFAEPLMDNGKWSKQNDRIPWDFYSPAYHIEVEKKCFHRDVPNFAMIGLYLMHTPRVLLEQVLTDKMLTMMERMELLTVAFAFVIVARVTQREFKVGREQKHRKLTSDLDWEEDFFLDVSGRPAGFGYPTAAGKAVVKGTNSQSAKKMVALLVMLAHDLGQKVKTSGSRYSGTAMQERLHSQIRHFVHHDDSPHKVERCQWKVLLREKLWFELGLSEFGNCGNSRVSSLCAEWPAMRSDELDRAPLLRDVLLRLAATLKYFRLDCFVFVCPHSGSPLRR
jgi:hypothetical protein